MLFLPKLSKVKRYLQKYVLLGLVFCSGSSFMFSQKISVDSSISLNQLIENNLIDGCVEISNITSSVNGNFFGLPSYAYFNRGTSNFPFQDGVMLSTGKAESGGNTIITSTLSEGTPNWGSDADLEMALGITNTTNATSIEFDLISATNQVQFNYLLASEEYFGINPCQFSDGFVFLIKQTGSPAPYQNIALIPGTSTPVNTNTIHDEIFGVCPAQNAQYFDGYNLGDTNYNGRTVPLTASATITPYVQYHIKLIIADQEDYSFDSAVFIEAISFNNIDLGVDVVTCLNSYLLDADIENPQAEYAWYIDNTLIPGEINPTLNVIQNGNYRVEITVPINNTRCLIEDQIQVILNSEPIINPISDYELCDDLSGDNIEIFDLQTKIPEILTILPSGNYNFLFYHSELEARSNINLINSPISNNSNPEIVYVSIENLNTGCFSYAPINLVVNSLPDIINPTNLKVCDNDATINGITDINLTEKDDEITGGQANLVVSYHITQIDAENGNNPISSPYVNASSPNFQSFFVRVFNSQTSCIKTTTLDVEIINSPMVNSVTQFIDACDSDYDGVASFDLTEIVPNVLQGLTGVTWTFHLTYEDAELGSNPITDPTNFLNTSPDVQTVFIRVLDNVTGCPSIVPIEVHTNLLLTGTKIEDFALCDDDTNDGIGEFSLPVITGIIANDLPNITVTYFESQDDLDNNLNAIDDSVPYTAISTKEIFIKIDNGMCSEQGKIKLLVNPILLFQPAAPMQYCDSDEDGIVSVDLHSLDSIVNNGNTNFQVSYFLSELDAESKSNELPNLYPVSGTKIFWARLENIDSGCHTENRFEIEVFPAPALTQPSPFIICDSDQDGFTIINLEDKLPEIVSNTTNLTISYFKSLIDAESNTNAITNPTTFNTNTKNIFVKVQNNNPPFCYSIETIKIIVNTLPLFPVITNYEICEDDDDNRADFLLSDKDNEILNGQAGKEVLYFEDSDYTIPIDKTIIYQNISSPQTIYVRVQNTSDTSCFGDTSFTIEVSQTPVYNVAFQDYLICDDISNDGKNIFNLTEKITEITQGATSGLNISFHINIQNAINNVNPLPLQYTNATNPQTLFVRIQGINSNCYVIEQLGINIIAAPDVTEASSFIQCDMDYDEKTFFDLNNADFQLLDRITSNLDITFYENEVDIEDLSKKIANPSNYANIINPQTVYIKVTNILTGCYSVRPLELIVNTPPVYNFVGTIEICDNDSKTYDLSNINNVIVDDPNKVNLSYYNNLNDAENNLSPLPNLFNYTSNFNTIFVRIEDPITGCIKIPSFNLQINPNPIAIQPPNLEACDDDYDGLFVFDLSLQKTKIIGSENPANFTVTYYTNLEDAENNENAFNNLHASFDGEIIYARMENISTGCFDTTSFSSIVFPLPVINIADTVPICKNDLPLIIDASTGNINDTYLWSTGETTNQIELMPLDVGEYWVAITSIDNCIATKAFTVVESVEATINFTTTVDFSDPNSITVDVSGIGNYVYILDNQEPQISNVFENVTFGPHIVTIRDLNGCQDVSKEVFVIDIPKFVTPNNDGYFDTWHIVGIEQLPGTIVYIYDRHGKLIKTLPSTSIGWDGTYRGKNMPSDDYWFVAKVKKEGAEFEVRGHFSLKR